MASVRPYQVCLYCGPTPPAPDGMAVIDVTPASASPEDVLKRIQECGMKPADLRARAVFLADCDEQTAMVVYAALIGFSGRRIDVASGAELLDVAPLHELARHLEDAGRPAEPVDLVQVGVPHPEVVSVTANKQLSEEEISLIRFARRLRFVPVGTGNISVLNQLILVSGIRMRGDADRLPLLCVGDEPVVGIEDEHGGVDLDAVRREAIEFRRTQRFDERSAIAERLDPGPRQRNLMSAAAQPIEDTLERLGAQLDDNSGLWHCPRPDRHTNGDANASLKTNKGLVRCYRCDTEPVDSLRLAADVLGASAEEAAQWLLSDARLPRLSYPGKPA